MVGDDNPQMYIFENLNGTGFRCMPDDESCRFGVVWNQTRTEIEYLVEIYFKNILIGLKIPNKLQLFLPQDHPEDRGQNR